VVLTGTEHSKNETNDTGVCRSAPWRKRPERKAIERFAIVLQATTDRDDVPAIIRLRRFLKMALRSYGLRCVEIKPADEQMDDTEATAQAGQGV
jgi:hypothetical protein